MTARKAAEAIPPKGIYRTEDHRYYMDGEGPYVGVTTALGVRDKPALVNWAKREVAACAVRNYGLLGQMMAESGEKAALDWLKRIPDYKREKAAELGTRVHALAEAVALGSEEFPEDDEAMPFVRQYLRWRDDWQPEYLAVEYMGIYPAKELTYGGTGDLMIRDKRGETWALDIKTGYFDWATAYQLEACARLWSPTDHGLDTLLPYPAHIAVLDLKPDGYKVVEYHGDRDRLFRAFLLHVEMWREVQAQGGITLEVVA